MAWELQEAVQYYKNQGAPGDQNALIGLLREVQTEHGGIPQYLLPKIAEELGTRESLLNALIRRIPSLRLSDSHCLELCAGPNCSRRAQLAAFVERTYGETPRGFELKYVPCMRQCGKGPNLKWDGRLYNRADEDLIRRLVEETK